MPKVIKDSGTKVSDLLAAADNLSDVAFPSAEFDNISPLTTKGDLVVHDGPDNTRLPAGPGWAGSYGRFLDSSGC